MHKYCTNLVQVPVTKLVANLEAEATIRAAGPMMSTLLPCIGSTLAIDLSGLYHSYRQVRILKGNEALTQVFETPRAVLETTTSDHQTWVGNSKIHSCDHSWRFPFVSR